MGQALYRKYRSKSLKEIVGQEHITKTLGQALKQGRISHAYLFTGPRGVGKTSIARILAHEINGLPYNDDSAHIDIIEIDAASNRRIDEIRDLRDKVYVAPAEAKYKVYIIDEVHMLTREAFNALLKTLEEPPAHVVFILATTDAHKLPATIISRTQRFSFRPAEKTAVIELLSEIADKEGYKVSSEALEMLAEHAGGSFRDSVSLLDQVSSQADTVEAENVRQLLGIPPAGALDELIDSLSADHGAVMSKLSALLDQGYHAALISGQLGRRLRNMLVSGNSRLSGDSVLRLLDALVEVPAAYDPERKLEIALLQAAAPGVYTEPKPADSVRSAEVTEPVSVAEPAPTNKTKPAKAGKPEIPVNRPAASGTGTLDDESWGEVLKALKQRYNTLYGVLRMAQPDFNQPGQLTLAFGFSFHQKRLLENSNRQKLADVVKEVTGQDISIECVVDKMAKQPKTAAKETKADDGEDLAAISNIFGGAELLES